MAKRVSPEAALLMLHWQNSVCDAKGVWGKNLCRQIEKNNAIKNAQSVLATARNRGMLTIFVNIGWRPGFPELPQDQYYPLLQGAKDENKGIVGTWEVEVIDALRPISGEPVVINFGSDSFEGTDLDRILRTAKNSRCRRLMAAWRGARRRRIREIPSPVGWLGYAREEPRRTARPR
jgi:nicotinamidase-related amidase